MNELALFAGCGGGLLASRLLGWRTICAIECNPYRAAVLLARQADGFLDPFPVWDDVRTFDGRPARGCGFWPTPQARDWKGVSQRFRSGDRAGCLPNAVVGGTATRPQALNPDWVEWLMGWPIGWTALQPLGTDRFQQWLFGHGSP